MNKLKTWWQGLNYWQKGGVIGLTTSVILTIVSLGCSIIIGFGEEIIYCMIVPSFWILELVAGITFLGEGFMIFTYYLFSAVIYWGIGALIGLIIGKVKKK